MNKNNGFFQIPRKKDILQLTVLNSRWPDELLYANCKIYEEECVLYKLIQVVFVLQQIQYKHGKITDENPLSLNTLCCLLDRLHCWHASFDNLSFPGTRITLKATFRCTFNVHTRRKSQTVVYFL